MRAQATNRALADGVRDSPPSERSHARRHGVSPPSARAIVCLVVLAVAACAPLALSGEGQPQAAPAQPTEQSATSTATVRPRAEPDREPLRVSTSGWKTDFARHNVPLGEISSGGPPRDGIPPLDQPHFEPVSAADSWLAPLEPVIHLAIGPDVRAYPLQILIWHEIVNDVVGGVPVAVTFCPLCNTAIAFDRRLAGKVLDFGTTGNLRFSDLVMWDRQTESWWQQVTGEAIVGELTGQTLKPLPATIVSWTELRQAYPDARVLSRQTGYQRAYGRNPYVGYDDVNQSPFLFSGKPDPRLPPMERVATVSLGDEDAAYPFSLLRERGVVVDRVGGSEIVIMYQPGAASALDAADIGKSRDVGAVAVYSTVVDGQRLSFAWRGDRIADAETGSRWDLFGRCVEGPLAGKQLTAVVAGNHFWFAWAVFRPATRVWRAPT